MIEEHSGARSPGKAERLAKAQSLPIAGETGPGVGEPD